MKNVIITIAFVLALTANAICQFKVSIQPNWTVAFNFGGTWDQPRQVTASQDNKFIYVSGNAQVPSGSPIAYAVITKMDLLGRKVWQVSGDTIGTGSTLSWSGIASTADGGVIWVIDPASDHTGFTGIIKLDSNGHYQWRFQCDFPAVQAVGDTVVVVAPEITTGIVYILDKNGQLLKQYTLPFAVHMPYFTIVGNYMYLISGDWNHGTYTSVSSYAAKINWRTGEKIWSREFLDAFVGSVNLIVEI